MSAAQHTVYRFEGFRLDVTRRRLVTAGGVALTLNSRAMEALLLLVANAGQVVDKRRLLQTVWPNTIVEDNNLNQCVVVIRRALGETAGSNRFVMTVPGRGYCFVCPVVVTRQSAEVRETDVDTTAPAVTSTRSAQNARHVTTTRPPVAFRRLLARPFLFGLGIGAAVVTLALLPFALH